MVKDNRKKNVQIAQDAGGAIFAAIAIGAALYLTSCTAQVSFLYHGKTGIDNVSTSKIKGQPLWEDGDQEYVNHKISNMVDRY